MSPDIWDKICINKIDIIHIGQVKISAKIDVKLYDTRFQYESETLAEFYGGTLAFFKQIAGRYLAVYCCIEEIYQEEIQNLFSNISRLITLIFTIYVH